MKKKLLAVVGAGAIAMTSLAGFAGCGGGSSDTFTWWIPAGDPTYYSNYEDNPVLSYISEYVELHFVQMHCMVKSIPNQKQLP